MTQTNLEFAAQILLTDPVNQEELAPSGPPKSEGNALVLHVVNSDGTRRWKHTIVTEEV